MMRGGAGRALSTLRRSPIARHRCGGVCALLLLSATQGAAAKVVAFGPEIAPAVEAGGDLRAVSELSLRALQDLNDGKSALSTGVPLSETSTTLPDAAALAFARSYTIGAADAGRVVAAAQHSAAIGALLPQFDARAAIGIERSAPASIVDTETGQVVPVDTHQRRDLTLTLSQPLVDWGSWASIARTRHLRAAAEAEADGALNDAGFTIAQGYFTLVQTCIGLTIAQAHRDRLAALQRWMTARVAGGGASVADGQQVDARVLAAASLVEQQKAARDQALITFEQLTGTKPGAVAIPEAILDRAPSSLDEALTHALGANPALLELRAQARAARSEHAGAVRSYLPTLSAQASQVGAKNAGGDPGWRRDRRIMLVATWSLQPLSAAENARAAAAKARQYEFQRLDQERTVTQAVRVVYAALDTVRVRVETARKELDANLGVAKSFDEQFSAGRKSLLELLDAYDRLYQSRQTMLQAGMSGALLYFQVLRVTGELGSSLRTAAKGAR